MRALSIAWVIGAGLALAACDGDRDEDAGVTERDSGPMDSGAPPSDGGRGPDGGAPNDAGSDAGRPVRRTALPSGGFTTIGPRPNTGGYRVFDEGFETNQRLCAGTVCITGSLRP